MAISIVQSAKYYRYNTLQAYVETPFDDPNTAGNAILAFGNIDDGSVASQTTTDNRNTFATGNALESFGKLYTAYAEDIAYGSNTVRNTGDVNCAQGLAVVELSGVPTSLIVRTSGVSSGPQDQPSATVTGGLAGDICFLNICNNGGDATLPAGFTPLYTDAFNRYWQVGYKILAGGTETLTVSTPGTDTGKFQYIVIKADAGVVVSGAHTDPIPLLTEHRAAKLFWLPLLSTKLANNPLNETGIAAFYYDAIESAERAYAFTSDAQFLTMSDRAFVVYKDGYVNPNGGNIPAYWLFTDGLTSRYLRDTTVNSSAGALVDYLCSHAAYVRGYVGEELEMENFIRSREAAYSVIALLNQEICGYTLQTAKLNNRVANCLSHLDQWITGEASFLKCFMMALTIKALIKYNTLKPGNDEINEKIPQALDVMWASAWNPTAKAFNYSTVDLMDGDGTAPAADLNHLIAPCFAYAWKLSGDAKWISRYNEIFAGGVPLYDGGYHSGGSYLGSQTATGVNGKHVNQNFVWMEQGVTWRTTAADIGQTMTAVIDAASNVTAALSVSLIFAPPVTPPTVAARTNLVLAYPEIPLLAKEVSVSAELDPFYPVHNLIAGHKYFFSKLLAQVSGCNYDFRLSSARAVDYFILGRADALIAGGVTQAVLQSSSDGSSWVGRLGTGTGLATRALQDSRNQDCLFFQGYNDQVSGALPTAGFAYWRLALGGVANYHRLSKFHCGLFFDFGGEPDVISKDIIEGDGSNSRSGAGYRAAMRHSEPRIRIRLRWRNVSDAKKQAFFSNIATPAKHRNGIYLVARDDTTTLDGAKLMYSFLDVNSIEKTQRAQDKSEIIATFIEEIG